MWFYGAQGTHSGVNLFLSNIDPRNISMLSLARTNCKRMNYLLKHDLNPASNDNSPAWLERAA